MNIFSSPRSGVVLCVAGSKRKERDRPTRGSAGIGFPMNKSEGLGSRRRPNLTLESSGVDIDLLERGGLIGTRTRCRTRTRTRRHSILYRE